MHRQTHSIIFFSRSFLRSNISRCFRNFSAALNARFSTSMRIRASDISSAVGPNRRKISMLILRSHRMPDQRDYNNNFRNSRIAKFLKSVFAGAAYKSLQERSEYRDYFIAATIANSFGIDSVDTELIHNRVQRSLAIRLRQRKIHNAK